MCQTEEEIDSFLEENYLVVVTSETAIDFSSVRPKEQTLVKQPKIELWERIGTRKDGARTYHKRLKEHKAELQDGRLNFMGLSGVKELSYMNTEDMMTIYSQDFSRNQRKSFIFSLSTRIVK